MRVDFCNSTERDDIIRLINKKEGDLDLKPLYTYVCPVIIFVCFFGILFNAILMTISRQSTVVNKSPILLLSLNLAVTDLVASFLNGFNILHNSYLPGVFDLKLLGPCYVLVIEALRCAALGASALHLLALAFVHYRGIVNPLHYRSTIFFSQHLSRTINLISIVCWILPLTLMLAWFSSNPCQGFQSPDCDILFLWGFSFRYMILTVFALPIILMSIIYLRIFVIISRHQKGRRLNHDQSILSRGVISAAAPMVTAAAVNLPELINKTGAIRCAACAARALADECDSSISDLCADRTSGNEPLSTHSSAKRQMASELADMADSCEDNDDDYLRLSLSNGAEVVQLHPRGNKRGYDRNGNIEFNQYNASCETRIPKKGDKVQQISTKIKNNHKNLPLTSPKTFFYMIRPKVISKRSNLGNRSHSSASIKLASDGRSRKSVNHQASNDTGASMSEPKALKDDKEDDDSAGEPDKNGEDVQRALLQRDTENEAPGTSQDEELGMLPRGEEIEAELMTRDQRSVRVAIDDLSKATEDPSRHHGGQLAGNGRERRLERLECTCDMSHKRLEEKRTKGSELRRSNTVANDNASEMALFRTKRTLGFLLNRHLAGSESSACNPTYPNEETKSKTRPVVKVQRSLSTRLPTTNEVSSTSAFNNTGKMDTNDQSLVFDSGNNNTNVISTNTGTTYEPQRRHVHASAVPQTNTKALITTLLILGTYFTSYVPAIIMQVLTCVDYCPYPVYEIPFDQRIKWSAVTTLLLIVKTIIDPFIYTYRMSEIQVAINRYFSKRKSKSSFAQSIQQTSQRFNTSGGLLANNTNTCSNQRNSPLV